MPNPEKELKKQKQRNLKLYVSNGKLVTQNYVLATELQDLKEKHTNLLRALQPLIDSDCILRIKFYLDRMFTEVVTHAPDNDVDSWHAKEFTPTYLALSNTLLFLYKNDEVLKQNIEATSFTTDFY